MERLGPFLLDVHGSQIDQFQQGHIGGKRAFCFGHFPDLPVKPLDGISGINHLSYGWRIPKVGGFWSLLATNFSELRIWYTTQVCTSVLGKMLAMASTNPLRLSMHAIRISSTPLC